MDDNKQKIIDLENKIKKLEDFCFKQNMQFQIAVWDNVLLKLESGQGLGIGKLLSSDTSALLELTSIKKGFIFSRMTQVQRDLISKPIGGLTIFNTTTQKLNIFTTAWQAITSA